MTGPGSPDGEGRPAPTAPEGLEQSVEPVEERLARRLEERAAAGHPAAVFSTTYAELAAMTGAPTIEVE